MPNPRTIVLVEQLADGWLQIATSGGKSFQVPAERAGECLREILADPNLPEPKLEPHDPQQEMLTALAEGLAGPKYGSIARSATPLVMQVLTSAVQRMYAAGPSTNPPGYQPSSSAPPPQPSAAKPPPRRPHRSY